MYQPMRFGWLGLPEDLAEVVLQRFQKEKQTL
jgi:hypothetical protein